jgi:uncharacterized protein (TIGR03086 family)
MSTTGAGDDTGGAPPTADIEADTRAALPRAIGIADAVVSMIDDDRRHYPTRCDEIDVEGLVGHLVDGLAWFAAAGVGRLYDPSTRPEPDLTGRTLREAYGTAADAVRLAWATLAPFRATYSMPTGPTSGWSLAGYICLEQVGHAFDLADAVDGPMIVPDDLTAPLLAIGESLGDELLRAPGMFGAAQPVEPGASATERVRAYLGRPPRGARPVPADG